MHSIFPALYKHLKLVSSTPIRNMATLAGNFVNASPIGDMTVWFLALDAELSVQNSPPYDGGVDAALGGRGGCLVSNERVIRLKNLYLGYKQLAKQPDEIITAIRFAKPVDDFRFNFEKVCKRTYLDIATVNTAVSGTLRAVDANGGAGESPAFQSVHVSAGGVGPIPLYLKETSAYLTGREIDEETITAANDIM